MCFKDDGFLGVDRYGRLVEEVSTRVRYCLTAGFGYDRLL